MPNTESQMPMDAECRPSPPVKARRFVCSWWIPSGGVARKTGKMCYRASGKCLAMTIIAGPP